MLNAELSGCLILLFLLINFGEAEKSLLFYSIASLKNEFLFVDGNVEY